VTLDTAIRGGDLVDGSGARRRRANVGIHEGRVVALGTVGPAREEIDASGLVVAPGFVDVHSHFDAQVFWDPALTPSSLHGVTTTLAGNCGFTLAPWDDSSSDYLVRMLAVVEGMPLPALQAGVPGDWTSTAEYLDRIDGTTAINLGFMVGHSAMRRLVMGPDAVKRHASAEEVTAMKRHLANGLAAGGLGFSSSWGVAHYDGNGDPVPSRSADTSELVALAGVCRGYEGTSLEFIPVGVDAFSTDDAALLTNMSTAAGRPLNWNLLRITAGNAEFVEHALAAGSHARAHGGKVIALSMPIPTRARFTFRTGFVLDALPDWKPIFALRLEDRVQALRDPVWRERLASGARRAPGQLADVADWTTKVIVETHDPDLKEWEGHTVGEMARRQGKEPLGALLDLVCADQLQTTFQRPQTELSVSDWQANIDAWRDGRAVIGASDAGAHLDFTANFDYQVYVLERAVRRHRLLELEEAVHFMSDVPAQLYGLRDRGRLTEGSWADIIIFDESTVGCGQLTTRNDLPSGAARLYAEPKGISRVVVNGTTVAADGALTGARPGRLLRSGTDTRTPSLA
jgi:N-acyl-D-aspartate/D-glutamate deacylase